jgi:hypothetical protein
MRRVAGCILRAFVSTKGSFVKDVGTPDIIGYRQNGNGNAQNADFELRFEVGV